MAETMVLPLRSVSQINQYTRCPQSYKLARIDKVWARPAAWLPQGSAVHTVLEEVERMLAAGNPMTLEEAIEMFKDEYAKEVQKYTDGPDEARRTPNLDWWTWSGPYSGPVDLERRWGVGQEQIEKFFTWKEDVGQEIWQTPAIRDRRCMTTENHDHHVEECSCEPSKPAIELSFKIDLDGILVRGFIDAVVVGPDGKPRVRDYKTGNTPGDDFQLGVYALAILMVYGVQVDWGDYYMAGKKGAKGKATKPYDLRDWTREAVTAKFHEVEAKIQAGDFEPLPEAHKCKFCDVSRSCPLFQN